MVGRMKRSGGKDETEWWGRMKRSGGKDETEWWEG